MKLQKAALLLLLSLLSACGNLVAPQAKVSSTSYSMNGDGFKDPIEDAISAQFTCPSSANILPQSTQGITNGVGEYLVCPSSDPDNYAELLVKDGTPVTGSTICVFPVRYGFNSSLSYLADTVYRKDGKPLYQCGALADSGLLFSFLSTGSSNPYNGVVVVESAVKDQMRLCMVNGFTSCPYYSLGRTR